MWLSDVKNDNKSAYCKICHRSFRIDNSGVGRVKSHEKCHKNPKKKRAVATWKNRITFTVRNEGASLQLGCRSTLVLSEKDQIRKAEITQALHLVEKNISYASAEDDNSRFKLILSDSKIAQGYEQSDTKVQYVMKYGSWPFQTRIDQWRCWNAI